MSNSDHTVPIRLGISPCPNDTFAFHALMHRLVDWRGLDFSIELLDIQQLNERLLAGQLDVGKTSFYAALELADRYGVLPSGSALGFGVGPLLLAAQAGQQPLTAGAAAALDDQPAASTDRRQLVLCPGRHTTATLLFRIFYPHFFAAADGGQRETTDSGPGGSADVSKVGSCAGRVQQVIFSQIMPRLIEGSADFGVCIHEGRFTWQQQGLSLVADLGELWERRTGSPLPLGGLVARRDLPPATVATVQAVIRDSIDYALADRQAALPTMRRYAQEFDDRVLMQHVDLYVNRWTQDLQSDGFAAVNRLADEARRAGVVVPRRRLEWFDGPP